MSIRHEIRPETENVVQLTINGHRIKTAENSTILEAARKHGIDIPRFCADPRLKPVGECGICVVEIKGAPELQRSCETKVVEGMEVTTENAQIEAARKGVLDSLLSNHNAYCEPPCHYACPAGIDIPGYIGAIARGDDAECIRIVKERLPLPRIIGRVCPRPCQKACRRKQVDQEPVAICQLKRFAGDSVAAGDQALPEVVMPSTGKSVAVVGSGPSGLSAAYYLAKQGHDVTIYEANCEAGGMMRTGIPEYRLPRDVLDDEINDILKLGVKLRLNACLGKDLTIEKLEKDNDAVYLAIGAQIGSGTGLTGNAGEDYYSAVDYLADVNAGQWENHLGKVVVIGGGFTALDAARSSKRLGAESVTVVYRRTKKEMPAGSGEVRDGETEGVDFRYLASPISLNRENGKVTGVIFQEMKLGEPDESGRCRPVPVEGSEFTLEADTVILAVGQEVDTEGFNAGLELNGNGTILTNELTLQTSRPGVFSGGDCITGPATVVEGIASGRRASIAVNAYINGDDVADACTDPLAGLVRKPPVFFDIAAKPKSEAKMKHATEIAADERNRTFDEIELGFTEEQARKEAERCLQCVCQASSDCRLQKYAIKYGAGATEFTGDQGQYEAYDGAPILSLDRKRCIKCHNCVRICDEVQQQHVYKIGEDGYPALKDGNYKESGCVFCGQCLSACPTGAIKDLTDRGVLRKDMRSSKETTCPYCGVGCRFDAEVEGDRVVAIRNDLETRGVNKGNLCIKGKFGYSFHDHPDRLTKPLMRESRDDDFREVSWDEALEFTAKRLGEIKERYGPRAMGAITSSRGTNEENFVGMKFYRAVIGTNSIDNCARVCHAPTVAGLYRAFGSGAATNAMSDIVNADLIFICGSNPTEAHPIAGLIIKEAVSNGSKLIVGDPRRIELAERADHFLRLEAGTNIALLNGMLNVIIDEGLTDEDFILERTENFELMKAVVAGYTPEKVADITGVDPETLRAAARAYANAKSALIIYSLGMTEHKTGSHGVMCLANLAMATGNVGRSGAGILVLRGQNNVQGSCDMGALPDYYTSYQRVDDPASQEKHEKAWGVSLSNELGLKEPEMYRAAVDGKFKSMHIIGYDPVKTQANLHFVEKAYDNMEFVVVQDIFMTKTAEKAHVILPAACYFEKDGTFTNAERRVQRIREVIPPPEGLKSDWEIVCDIAQKMGVDMSYDSASDVMDEIAELTPQYHGISFDRIETEELQWPVWDKTHEGTPIMHHGSFVKGLGTFHDIAYAPAHEMPDDEYPMMLVTGRRLYHYCNGSMTQRTPLMEVSPEELLEVNPEDATRLGLKDGDRAKVASRRGEIEVTTKVTEKSRPGSVFLSFHYDATPTNYVTSDGEDEIVLTPEYKVCAVRITK